MSKSAYIREAAPFLAPEQWESQAVPASDQYALAIMTFFLLTGRFPFQGSLGQIISQHQRAQPPVLSSFSPQLDPSFDKLIARALAKKPAQRFPSVTAFAQTFQKSLQNLNEPVTQHPLLATPPISAIASGEERHATLRSYAQAEKIPAPPATIPHAATSPHTLISPAPRTMTQPGLPGQGSIALLPAFAPARHTSKRRSLVMVVSLLLALVILGGGMSIHRAVTGQWSWSLSHGQSPSLSPRQSTHAHDSKIIPTPATSPGWHAQTSGTTQSLNGIAWSGSQFVVVGNRGTILTSFDGSHWTVRTSATSQSLNGIAWSGSQFVAVGDKGTILTSSDGSHWTARTSGTLHKLWIVTWVRSQFMVVGDMGTILTSSDGSYWIARTSGTRLALWSIDGSDSLLVAVGDKGIILTSSDGSHWTPQTSGTSQALNGVVWSGSQFVIAGGKGTILTSSDGNHWTPQISGTSHSFWVVVWTHAQFVAMGNTGVIFTSSDGSHWTSQTSGTSQLLTDIAWSGSLLVAVGDKGTILTSL